MYLLLTQRPEVIDDIDATTMLDKSWCQVWGGFITQKLMLKLGGSLPRPDACSWLFLNHGEEKSKTRDLYIDI